MKSLLLNYVAAAWCALLVAPSAIAGVPANAELVPLHNGINEVNFGPKTVGAMVMLAHRENFNAHSFAMASFYLRTDAQNSQPKQWQVVPFHLDPKSGNFEYFQKVGGGADCQTCTFRLLVDRKTDATYVVIAERQFGDSFADTRPVTFTWLKLTRGNGLPGEPVAWFKPFEIETTKAAYCNVDQAIKTELRLDGAMMPREGSLGE
jgi:hypothetical protein